MKITKKSLFTVERKNTLDYAREVDFDLFNVCEAFKGRIRFGDVANGIRSENLSGEFRVFTSHAVADTEFAVTHSLGAVPVGRIILYQDIAGTLYQGPTTGTAWTDTTIYFKCDVSSVTFAVFLLK